MNIYERLEIKKKKNCNQKTVQYILFMSKMVLIALQEVEGLSSWNVSVKIKVEIKNFSRAPKEKKTNKKNKKHVKGSFNLERGRWFIPIYAENNIKASSRSTISKQKPHSAVCLSRSEYISSKFCASVSPSHLACFFV